MGAGDKDTRGGPSTTRHTASVGTSGDGRLQEEAEGHPAGACPSETLKATPERPPPLFHFSWRHLCGLAAPNRATHFYF